MTEELLNKIIENYETPTYVFDIKTLKNRIQYLKNNLPSKIDLCYAIKANTFIIKDIENYVDRFEVCSMGEYEICMNKNIDNNKILISGINKEQKSINKIIENSNVDFFTIESMEQYKMLKSLDKNIKVLIRLTSGNQFGINEEDVEQIIQDNPNFEICGIQYFSGTQKTSIKKLEKEIQYVDSFIEMLETKYDLTIKELEFGTGFPVYYFKENEFNETEFLKQFSNILDSMKFKGKIILEVGRSIAASCGLYITKVIDKKTNNNENYAIVDGGMNHIVYYGQFMAMKVPDIKILPERKIDGNEKWNICGSLCSVNDILVKQLCINNLQIGDILVFKNTGAYCMTEGMSLFLSRDLPQILKIREDQNIEVIRKILPIYDLNM